MASQTRRIRISQFPNVRPEGALFSQCFKSIQEAGKWYWETGNGISIVHKAGDAGIDSATWRDVIAMEQHQIQEGFGNGVLFMVLEQEIYGKWFIGSLMRFFDNTYGMTTMAAAKKDAWGHLVIDRGTYLDRGIIGNPDRTHGTPSQNLIDTTKNWSTDYGVSVGDIVVNLTDHSKAVVTGFATDTNPNDTIVFAGGLSGGTSNTFVTTDTYLVFVKDWKVMSVAGNNTTYQHQIEVLADRTYVGNGSYLASYSDVIAADFDSQHKQFPQFDVFSCMASNNGYLLIGTRDRNDNTGSILLWDTFSDGFNAIIKMGGIVTSIRAMGTGWAVSCNGIEYYTDGYSLTQLFDWGAGMRAGGNMITSPKCEGKIIRNGSILMFVEGSEYTRDIGGVLNYQIKTGDYSISPLTPLAYNTLANSVKSPATMADDSAVGTVSWSDVDNAKVEDDTFANAVFAGSSTIPKDYLVKLLVGGVVSGQNKGNDANLSTTNIFYNYGSDVSNWYNALTPAIVNAVNFGVVLQHRSGAVYTHYLKASNFGFTIPTASYISGVKVRVKQKYSAGGGDETVWVDYIEITVYYRESLKITEDCDRYGEAAILYYADAFHATYIAGSGLDYFMYGYRFDYSQYNNAIGITQAIQFPRQVKIEKIHLHLAPTDNWTSSFYGLPKLEIKIADANQKLYRYGTISSVLAANKIRVDGTNPLLNIAELGDEIHISGGGASSGQHLNIILIEGEGTVAEDWTLDRNFNDTPTGSPSIQIRPFKSLGSITITPSATLRKTQSYLFDNNVFKRLTDRIYIEVLAHYIYGELSPTIRIAAIEVEYTEAERS